MGSLRPYLFIPDTHRPLHDRRAWKLVLEVARWLKPYGIVVVGDFADFRSISRHSKSPVESLGFEGEVKDANIGLDDLDALGATDKVFIAGNHEWRLWRYLAERAPELYRSMSVEELLRLQQRGWQYVPYHKHTRRGKLYLTHDVGYSGRYAVYHTGAAFEHSVVSGHSHRFGLVVEGNSTGIARVSAQFGWLGDITKVDWMHQSKAQRDWPLGFGIGYLNPTTGYAYLQPIPIVNYTACVNGQLFTQGKKVA